MKHIKKHIPLVLLFLGATILISLEIQRKHKSMNIPPAQEVSSLIKKQSKEKKEEKRNQYQKIYSFLIEKIHRQISSQVNKANAQKFVVVKEIPTELSICADLKENPPVFEGSFSSSNLERLCRSLDCEDGIDKTQLEKAWSLVIEELKEKGYAVKRENEQVFVQWP